MLQVYFFNEIKNPGNLLFPVPGKTCFQDKPWAHVPLDGLTAQWKKLVETGTHALSGWLLFPPFTAPLLLFRVSTGKTESQAYWVPDPVCPVSRETKSS